jgi:glycosyltransferase involved in cell wall biosynthesis
MTNSYNPLVSIVIPVYNGENYIQSAIDSALGQNYKNKEIVIVNDGSTDNTDKIIKNYSGKLKYLIKENGGVSTALNLAIQKSCGEYISWLSHDDYYLPNKISKQIKCLDKLMNIRDNCDKLIVCCNHKLSITYKNKIIPYILSDYIDTSISKINSLKLLFLNYTHGCSLLIPKKAFEDCGYFNTKLQTTQDLELFFKFVYNGYLFYSLKDILMVARAHGKNDFFKKQSIYKQEYAELLSYVNDLFDMDIKSASVKDRKIINNLQSHIVKRRLSGNIRAFLNRVF